MERPTDEVLMAFADGALDDAARSRIAEYLLTDPDASKTVDVMSRGADLARAAFGSPEGIEVPPGLAERILSAQLGARRKSSVDWPGRHYSKIAFPAAAAMAAAVGGAAIIATLLLSRPASDDAEWALGPVEPASVLGRLLETTASGAVADDQSASSGQSLQVTSTFFDRNKRPCREVESVESVSRRPISVAVGCRGSDGSWIVEGAARLTLGASTPSERDYTPSEAPERPALESLHQKLGIEPAVPSDQEQKLLRQGWKLDRD